MSKSTKPAIAKAEQGKAGMADYIKNAARWILAVVLLFWLYKSHKLGSLEDLGKLLDSPGIFALAVAGFVVNYVLNFLRWEVLLRGIGIRMPFAENVRLSMIGQFFSIIMPGAVGGDLIKAVYVAKEYPEHRTAGAASVLLDRVLGFLSLLLGATLFFFLSFDVSTSSQTLQGFALLISLGTLALLLAVLLPGTAANLLTNLGTKNPLIEKLARVLKAFARSPKTLFYGLLLSFGSQSGGIFGYYMLGRAVFGPLPWGDMGVLRFISGTSVGTAASALPISPMGLGVGQVAFGEVFRLLGAPSEKYGINVITAAQIVLLMLNLSGALWFLKSKRSRPS